MKELFYQDLQETFGYYLKNDSYLVGALDGLKKYEQRSFISSVLSYEYQNLVVDDNLELDKNGNAILPQNLIAILNYDKRDFQGAILKNFINDLEFELEHIEMELYDDPSDFEGGDYWDEDSDCDEDYTIDDWVTDQTSDIRSFIDALIEYEKA